ncbi:hypothetical protein IID20_00460 [Patescibacteria group bacterium]|nr:hypothetical protein [Patescibacteria group bacterium]
MKIFKKINAWLWPRKSQPKLEKLKVVVDTSALLNKECFEKLLSVKHVFIPIAVWEQLGWIATWGPVYAKDELEKIAIKEMAQNIKSKIKKIFDNPKKRWDIIGSQGTGLVPKFAKRTLDDLEKTAKYKLIAHFRNKGEQIDFEKTTWEDILGIVDLRVLASAYFFQDKSLGNDEELILLVRDTTMSILAYELGIQAITDLDKIKKT